MLIGPRYVLTALHVLGTLDANNQLQEVHSLQVSPARNGNNTSNPFGAIKTTAIRVPPERIVRFTVGQGKQTTTVTQRMRDDYALIILPKDIDGLTHKKMRGPLGFLGPRSAHRRCQSARAQGHQRPIGSCDRLSRRHVRQEHPDGYGSGEEEEDRRLLAPAQ